MKVLIIPTVVFITAASACKPNYYWKEYNGIIPCDALNAALSTTDTPLYIGQGYFPQVGLLPGKITPGLIELKAISNNREYRTDKHIKILATNSICPEKDFQWISIHARDYRIFKKLPFIKPVIGGFENNQQLHVGRYRVQFFSNIGKVHLVSKKVSPDRKLTLANEHGNIHVENLFDVLTINNYVCNDQNTFCIHPCNLNGNCCSWRNNTGYPRRNKRSLRILASKSQTNLFRPTTNSSGTEVQIFKND